MVNSSKKKSFIDSSFAPVIILFIALVIRLPALILNSLYVDEAVTLYISQRPIAEIVPFMVQVHEVHPPLYFWFINTWIQFWDIVAPVVKHHLLWMRLSSVIFGVLTVQFTFLLGNRLFNRKTALLASLLVALSSFHVYYCQELRMYPMILFFMLASFYFFIGLIKKPDFPGAAGYIISSGLALLTHYYAFYIFAIEFLFLVMAGFAIYKKRKKEKETPAESPLSEIDKAINEISGNSSLIKPRVIWIIGSVCLSWLFFVPWLPYFLKQTGAQDFTLRMTPGIADFFEIFSQIAYGFAITHPHAGKLDFFIAASIIPIFLIIGAFIKTRGIGKWFVGIYLLFPVLMTFLVTLVSRFHIFEFKYFFIIVPAFWLLISAAILEFDVKWIRWVFILVFVFINLWTNFNAQLNPYYQPQDWREAARIVKENLKPGDLVGVHPSMMSVSMFYYYGNIKNFLPMDYPDDERMKLLKDYRGLWIISTPHHPFVHKAGLLEYLRKTYPPGKRILLNKFRPSDVILIEYFDLEKQYQAE